MKKTKKVSRWPDYERVDLGDIVTFGTSIFMRKDKKAIRILFPAGQAITFEPLQDKESDEDKKSTSHIPCLGKCGSTICDHICFCCPANINQNF